MWMEDFAAVVTLVLVELVLSADNSVALAILVRSLAPPLQTKALFYGLAGALAFRALALLGARWLLQSWWLQACGAVYMLYIVAHHFLKGHTGQEPSGFAPSKRGFWQTTVAVELVDAAFAVDSILAAVALSSKLWVIYTAAVIGVVGIRIATSLVIKLLETYPTLEDAAYLIVGWIGIKLVASAWDIFARTVLERHALAYLMPEWLFWFGVGVIAIWTVWGVLRGGTPRGRGPTSTAS